MAKATDALEGALKNKNLEYDINPGDGAFYGPKIDIKLKDALKRSWQCATIQCDFALPKRFNICYIDNDGKERQPIVLHRVLLGSLERFIGALIEHYNGDFPLWLAPVQVLVIPLKDSVLDYSVRVKTELEDAGIRVELDRRGETLDKKIRAAELNKIPYVVVLGEKEEKMQSLSIRRKGKGVTGNMILSDFIKSLQGEIKNKAALSQQ